MSIHPAQSVTASRKPELDGLRAFAILPVLLLHFTPYSGPLTPLAPLTRFGWIGVDLFFVLSGFLITGVLLEAKDKPGYYWNFIRHRAIRIFPLYYACLVLYAVVGHVRGLPMTGWLNPAWFWIYLGNVAQVFQNTLHPHQYFIVLWSLQVEEQFYLLYPALVATCSESRLSTVLTWCMVLALVIRVALLVAYPELKFAGSVLMPARMDSLAIGGLLALAHRHKALPGARGSAVAATVCVAACILVLMTGGSDQQGGLIRSLGYSAVGLAAGSILALILASEDGVVARALRWSPFVLTGRISYGLYLLHIPAAHAARVLLSPWITIKPGSTLNVAFGIPAAYVAAALSWWTLERWGRRVRSDMARRELGVREPSPG